MYRRLQKDLGWPSPSLTYHEYKSSVCRLVFNLSVCCISCNKDMPTGHHCFGLPETNEGVNHGYIFRLLSCLAWKKVSYNVEISQHGLDANVLSQSRVSVLMRECGSLFVSALSNSMVGHTTMWTSCNCSLVYEIWLYYRNRLSWVIWCDAVFDGCFHVFLRAHHSWGAYALAGVMFSSHEYFSYSGAPCKEESHYITPLPSH